jgi:MYXO-CTERM domain-containing protein
VFRKSILGAAVTLMASVFTAESAFAQQSRGPDAFNHVMSDNINAALFSYVNITATGTLLITDDDSGAQVNFPAGSTLTLYGAARSSLKASTNGFLTTDLTDTGFDRENDCPVPQVPGVGGGDRLYVLHDDLVTSVYYQYFPEATPPPGWIGNTSVIQWTGNYFNTTTQVNFEVLVFHSLDVALFLYQTVGQTGTSSTTGAQVAGATTGMNFACNTAGSISSGKMIGFGTLALNELRIDQPGADNDEYFELAGVPGFNLNSLTLIAIGDNAVVGNSGIIESVTPLTGRAFPNNGSVRFVGAESTYTLGTADATFSGGAGLNFENTDTVTYALVSGFSGANGQDLDTNDDGLLDLLPWTQVVDVVSVLHEPSPPVASEWAYASTAIVAPFDGAAAFHVQRCGDVTGAWVVGDPDPANGGDSPAVLNDCPICGDSNVSFPEACDDGGESAACNDDCTDASCGDGTVNMTAGEACDDGDLDNEDDCPDDGVNGGTCQPSTCADGFVDGEGGMTEACDGDGAGTPGETATCDTNCTVATCGDMTVNNTAGETCDAGARTATCDSDCTAVSCGDGHVNAADGEMCDGDGAGMGGETATCDDDCTTAMCGDGVVNATANEDCDDSGESADCDDDCTDAVCGDNTENTAAGEQCDDGNTDNGDGCDATCQDEGTGGMGGGSAGMGGSEGGMGGSAGGMGGTGNNGGAGGSGNSGNSSPDDDENDDETSESGGCDCSTPGTQGNPLAPWGVLLGLGLIARRRRTS